MTVVTAALTAVVSVAGVAGVVVGAGAAASASASTGAAASAFRPRFEANPVTSARELSSRPAAPKTIFLSFDGGSLIDTQWNETQPDPTAPLTLAAMAPDSAEVRTATFERMSEIFAPFDVDVTTSIPSEDRLVRDTPDDPVYGVTVIVSDSDLEALHLVTPGTTGISQFGSFGDATGNYSLVSSRLLQGSPQYLAAVMAHEIGHTLNLGHSGFDSDEYYEPAGIWGPLMGGPFRTGFARWTDNRYPSATRDQDQLAVMTDQSDTIWGGLDYLEATGDLLPPGVHTCGTDPPLWASRDDGVCHPDDAADPAKRVIEFYGYQGRLDVVADDVPDGTAEAQPLTSHAEGLIGTNTDRDAFVLDVGAGTLRIRATPAAVGPNLDIRLTLADASGRVVAVADPPDSIDVDGLSTTIVGADAGLELKVPAGRYTVVIDGVGFGDIAANTRDVTAAAPRYGSLGRYTIDVSAPPAPFPTPTPVPVPDPSPPPAPPAPGGGSGSGTTLAATGSGSPATAVAASVALVALLLGAMLATAHRRRRPPPHGATPAGRSGG